MNILPIPEDCLRPAERAGRVERLDYAAGGVGKHALVYVPFGYDGDDRPYDVFYLIHGGGGDQADFFRPEFLAMLDHLFEAGLPARMLVVCPSYYAPEGADRGISASGAAVAGFARELKEDVIPAVERRYRVYAARGDGLRANRDHRAVGGFSMGAVATWYAFLDALDAFRWFMPLSGDCWLFGELGGSTHAEQTARALAEAVARQGFGPGDFRIHAITGTKDVACPNETAQIDAMRAFPEVFRFGDNIDYDLLEGGVHDYADIRRYIYNALPGLFRA